MQIHRLRLTLVALLTGLALTLAACGGDDESSTDVGDLGPDPATMAPADAPVYAEAVLRPSGTMLDDFNSAFGKLLGSDDPSAMIRDALEGELASSDSGFTYSEDIEPWLGPRAGGFITDYDPSSDQAEGAVAVAVTDPDAAQAFIQKASESDPQKETEASYNGVDYLTDEDGAAVGIDGEFLVVGTEQGFKDAVDAAAGDSLAESDTATAAREETPDNSLFSGFVDTEAVIELIKRSGGLSPEEIQNVEEQVARYGDGPIDFWGTVEESTITLAGSSPAPEDASDPSDLVSGFPADAWLAFASADVGEQIQTSLDQFEVSFQSSLDDSFGPGVPRDLQFDPTAEFRKATGLDLATDFDWIGEVGGFVQGSSLFGLGGGLVFEATDEEAAAATLDKLQAALAKELPVQVTETETGFRVQPEDVPLATEVALDDGKVVIAAGADSVEDVLSPDDTLESSDRFNAAREVLGEDASVNFFLDFAPIVSLIESTGEATSDPDYQMAKPYLDSLDYLVAGSRIDGDRVAGSLVLGVREAPASSEDEVAATITP